MHNLGGTNKEGYYGIFDIRELICLISREMTTTNLVFRPVVAEIFVTTLNAAKFASSYYIFTKHVFLTAPRPVRTTLSVQTVPCFVFV